MKHALFVLVAVGLFACLVGCQNSVGRFTRGPRGNCRDCPQGCQSIDSCSECGGNGCRSCRGSRVDPVPPSGAVTYPYYTTRGPRDFLAKSPRPIGP